MSPQTTPLASLALQNESTALPSARGVPTQPHLVCGGDVESSSSPKINSKGDDGPHGSSSLSFSCQASMRDAPAILTARQEATSIGMSRPTNYECLARSFLADGKPVLCLRLFNFIPKLGIREDDEMLDLRYAVNFAGAWHHLTNAPAPA
ncbi:hypothetical protein CH63R_08530 [Colletotrichum higginsianum IMI 349063]|uniref:Uncharacterized protein n=1 Tax=Colletotrichum higginsianum (strain IMI 349063) TaxID=759273 RepID=A0A1B7Y4N8_COLHI|nr:hypothetical protein CH63R_08530 [Colletotrichum higginsianum IMI 349063]OBR07009.1 hypothetical protein CH63R_08530 [Colletotrichum higginsianum IMI 349063]